MLMKFGLVSYHGYLAKVFEVYVTYSLVVDHLLQEIEGPELPSYDSLWSYLSPLTQSCGLRVRASAYVSRAALWRPSRNLRAKL